MSRKNPLVSPTGEGLPKTGEAPIDLVVTRGNAEESLHRVHALVIKSGGAVEAKWGNSDLSLFPRSAIKIIQAVPIVQKKLHEKYALDSADLALACASHHGEAYHTERVSAWLQKLSLQEKDLECGVHAPYDEETFHKMLRAGGAPSQIHNNCSGKHCGLMTQALELDRSVAGYTNFDHPVQEELRVVQERFFSIKMQKWGIDGCGIPTYSIPLLNLGLGLAKIANPKELNAADADAVKILQESILENPTYIGGRRSFCTEVIQKTKGRVIAKVGAEGVYGAWIPEQGVGIALKCEDGGTRAAKAVLYKILESFGMSFENEVGSVKRWTGDLVGHIYCRCAAHSS